MTDTFITSPPPNDGQDAVGPDDDRWTLARDLYLSGQTGAAVCDALGIPPSTFWRRAGHDNWLRRDRLPAQDACEPLDLSAPVDEPEAALDKAWRRACVALDAGRSGEAMRWIRIHGMLSAQIEAGRQRTRRHTHHQMDTAYKTARTVEVQARTAFDCLTRERKRWEKVKPTPTDSHRPSGPPDPDEPGISRAERRRRQKYLTRAGSP